MSTCRKFAWRELAEDRPLPLIARRRIVGDRMMISHVSLSKGFSVATHAHDNEQMSVVLSGRFRFFIGTEGTPGRRTVEVGAGEVMVLPSNTPHGGEALEDTVILDLFSPPSEKTGVDAPARA